MSKRSDRYKDSPTLERDDESGKMKATKKPTENAKASAQESSGTAGMKHHEVHEMEHKHSKERMELFHKHEKEHMDLKHKTMKEESKGSGSGQGKINKVEGDK